jgi:predicted transcriptional regulator
VDLQIIFFPRMKIMKKIGPLSADIVVACQIYKLQEADKKAGFSELAEGLKGKVSKTTILTALNTLSDWGIVSTEFGVTTAGRAGRLYYVSGEAELMIKETCDKFWNKVLEAKGEEL